MAETEDCARSPPSARFSCVADPVIEREEVVGLLFNVSDIAESLREIERLLREDNGEAEDDSG